MESSDDSTKQQGNGLWGADTIKRKIGGKLSEERRRFDAKSFGQRNTHSPVDLMFHVD